MNTLKNPRALAIALASSLAVVAPVLTMLVVSPTASAQPGGGGGGRGRGFGMFGGGGGGDALGPSFNAREFTRISKVLKLDKDQEEAAKMLYDSFEEQLRAKAEPTRTKMERARDDFRENQDPSVWQDVRKEMEKFRPQRDEMEKNFLNDFKAMLRENQAQQWPHFERSMRREQFIGRGMMSGERLDLFKITDKADLSEDTKGSIAPILDLYEQDLDRELAARAAFQKDNMSKFGELMFSGDTKAMQDLFEKGKDLSIRVRDVNRRYARQIQDLVPEDKKAIIADEVKKESYPRVFQQTRATRILDAAVAMKDVTDEQKATLTTLRDSYNRDLDALHAEMITATDKLESTITAESMMSMFRNGGDDGPMGDLNRKRAQLNRKTEDAARKVLTPEQAAKLPKEDNNGPGQRGRGGNGGGNADRPQRATPRNNAGPGGGPG